MTTLLEQAKQIKIMRKSKEVNPEMVDLAIAWLNSEVSTAQAKIAMSLKGDADVRYYFISALKHAVLSGWVKIERINHAD